MNQHSLTRKKYYLPLIGTALAVASLFQFSLPVFAAGTKAGQVLRNTATGTYEDDAGNPYTIESNPVEVTVAKVAGITNLPTGFDDLPSSPPNTTVLPGDRVAFEFTISNVGNDISNIFIPDLANISTKGLIRTTTNTNDSSNFVIQVSPALTANGTHTFAAIPATGAATETRPTTGIVENVPINGKVIVRVTSTVSATAAGAPIEVRLGDTPPNTDPNVPVAATQNQPDAPGSADTTDTQTRDVRTENATTPGSSVPLVGGQKEASAVNQVFLGANPLAMTRIEKTRGTVQPGATAALNDNIIPYSLDLEVLNTTPNSLYTPGDLEGRDFASRITGIVPADASNLILISDAIPTGTKLNAALTPVGNWTPVYSTATTGTPFTMQWTTTAPTLTSVTRVGWVYDARPTPTGDGPIASGTTITAAQGGFTFNVITSDLNASTGGTVANIAQVFGGTVNGLDIFDESGDQDPSNFNGTNPGPNETDTTLSTGIANPATHGVDRNNDNNTAGADPASPGGEDNVLTIGAPGDLLNGPDGQPTATGDVFGVGPDNDHDFQNLGVKNFTTLAPNAQHNATVPTTLNPGIVTFNNTLSNPGGSDLSNVLLQPINPEFDPDFDGSAKDTDLPLGTTVTIKLGTETATYTYQDNAATPSTTDRIFVLTSDTPIEIPTLAAGVPLDYQVEVDLPAGTGLSTDDAINGGFPVAMIAFVDGDSDGTPDVIENRNITVNQVYTGHIKVSKQVRVVNTTVTPNVVRSGMNFDDPNSAKQPLPGDILEYRVIYRNISEPQTGNGTNVVLNGVDVIIDEDGTLDYGDDATLNNSDNNWGLDNNADGDLDTVNVQNSAADTNNGTITFHTGRSTSPTPINSLTSAGTTDPGDTVTGYRSTVPLLAPAGAESVTSELTEYNAPGDSAFTFKRTVDKFDGLGAEGLNP
ncbi:MAG: hypothetical protein KME09_11805 [Pleurocapsa minor HA4230-MV1]|jgi:hypothetical protein|nr:hypothetical protein [Pleurocapsa minor HA4230-MV1]